MNFKKKALALVLTTSLTASLFGFSASASTQTFADVSESHWAFTAIESMVEKGYINGMPDGTFAPNQEVTYGELFVMLTKAFCGPELETALADDDYVHWAGAYQAALCARASLSTSVDKMLALDASEPATRFQTSSLVSNVLGSSGVPSYFSVLSTASMSYQLSDLSDKLPASSPVHDWSLELLKSAPSNSSVALGIMGGVSDTDFNQSGTLTRAEAAMILYRLVDTNLILERPLYGEMEESWLLPGQYDTRVYLVPADTNLDGFITEEEVQTCMLAWEALYPHGDDWGSGTRPNWTCGMFADGLLESIWGNLPGRVVTDVNDMRIGDSIWYKYSYGDHIAVCTTMNHFSGAESDEFYATADGNVGGKVAWGGTEYREPGSKSNGMGERVGLARMLDACSAGIITYYPI